MKTIKLLAMALVACMALCSLPVPLTIPVIPAHTPLPAICAQEAPKAIDLGVCVKWAAKDIGYDGVAPLGRDFQDIAVLDPCTIEHAARRVKLDAVVVDVHVNFTADLGHIPMDEVVYAAFQYGAVGVLREVEAIVREFEPAFRRAGLNEAGHHLEQVQQVAAILGVVDGIRFC